MYRKPNQQRQQPPGPPATGPNAQPKTTPCSLDDDPELEHIARFSPPELEVGPDSDSRAGRDVPPPMIRPAHKDAQHAPKPQIEHIAPLGPLTERAGPEDGPGDNPGGSPGGSPETGGEAGRVTHAVAPVNPGSKKKIRAFEQKLGGAAHEDTWNRTPNITGTGAIHVKSFHCKLTGDSLEFLDMQVNEWLDAHPQYEVKQVTTSVGEWSGKTREPALIVNVWV